MPVVVPLTLREAIDAIAAIPARWCSPAGPTPWSRSTRATAASPRVPAAPVVVAVDRVAELRSWTIDPGGPHGHDRRGCHVRRTDGRAAGDAAARAGGGVTNRRVAADPDRRHARRQPRHMLAGRRRVARCCRRSTRSSSSPAPGGDRTLSVHDFMVGVKRTALEPGELITAVTVPLLDGWQGYSKVGVRNAMVIATASACLAVHAPERSVRLALGSVGPTIIRATEAESFAATAVDWDRGAVSATTMLVGSASWPRAASRPIDDHRSTAAYRRHAIGVMAARLLRRAFPGGSARERAVHAARQRGRPRRHPTRWLGENLLYVLRERLGLLAAKGACEQGECGSCSVLVDDRLVCSCLVLGASAVGRRIVTVEGLAEPRCAERRAAGVRRHRRGAVRVLHTGPDRRRPCAARPHPRAVRPSRSARSSRATCAGAPGTAGSSRPCSASPSPVGR